MITNAAALSRLLVEEWTALVRVPLNIVGNHPAAEDVAQHLWLRVGDTAAWTDSDLVGGHPGRRGDHRTVGEPRNSGADRARDLACAWQVGAAMALVAIVFLFAVHQPMIHQSMQPPPMVDVVSLDPLQ
ncbi:MAG: hypothetical protein ABW039_14615 [Sphingobium sp.]